MNSPDEITENQLNPVCVGCKCSCCVVVNISKILFNDKAFSCSLWCSFLPVHQIVTMVDNLCRLSKPYSELANWLSTTKNSTKDSPRIHHPQRCFFSFGFTKCIGYTDLITLVSFYKSLFIRSLRFTLIHLYSLRR